VAPGKEVADGAHRGHRSTVRHTNGFGRRHSTAAGELRGSAMTKRGPAAQRREGGVRRALNQSKRHAGELSPWGRGMAMMAV
jgi:hypothetical protein